MFGFFTFDWLDYASWIAAALVTIYVVFAANPHAEGTDKYQALRLCRISLALVVWSFGFGLIGMVFAVTAFILAVIGIVKGRTLYGILLIIMSVCLPIVSLMHTAISFLPPLKR